MNSRNNTPVSSGETPISGSFNRASRFLGGAKLFTIVLGATLLFSTAQNLQASSRADTLQAINWVENPSDSPKPGKCGELGAYQFRAATWQMHTQRPFSDAVDRRCSDEVAVLHYEWLKTSLARAGVEPTTYNIALAWNAGYGAVVKGRAPAVSHDYAERVNNLVVDLRSRAVAMK
jgi:hypothetical protein